MDNYKQALVSEMLESMQEADLDKWMALVYSKDDLVNEALRDWFQGRIQTQEVVDIQLIILDMDYGNSNDKVKCRFTITYKEYDPVTEVHIYTFAYVPERNRSCVVWLEKERMYFPFGSNNEEHKFVFESINNEAEKKWWMNEELVEAFAGSNDLASVEKYARAVIRNIRFREACLELECASLLSNMMSFQINELCGQIYDKDKKKLLANIFNATRDIFKIQLIREDRDNTWSSKFVVPWYGFDELIEVNRKGKEIKGSCFNFISFIYALLRICGFSEKSIYQLRLINQDILVVFIEDESFMIDSDNIILWNNKSIYFRNRVSKMFTENWCITDKNYIGLSEGRVVYEIGKMQRCLRRFNFFDHRYNAHSLNVPKSGFSEDGDILRFDRKKSAEEIVKDVINKAKSKGDSVYVWAKYAHQMLFVTKPEAYLYWSIQSKVVVETLGQYDTFEEWLDMIRGFEKESIFSEDYRIMTADQCIRYKKGDSKALLTVLYVWFAVKEKQNCFLAFTTKGYYLIGIHQGQMVIWNGETLERGNAIEGNVILAFHHKESYFPLWHQRHDISLKAEELMDYMIYTKDWRTKTVKYNLILHLPKKLGNTMERFPQLDRNSRILILSPHYDDDVIGCGGAIWNCCALGCPCSVLYFTDGSKNKEALGTEGYKEIRKGEASAALKELGNVIAFFWEEKDGQLSVCDEIVEKLQRLIMELRADTIFFPNMKDSYSDHNIVGNLLSKVLGKKEALKKLYMYEIIECLQEPNIYLELEEAAIEKKRRAIEKHETQMKYMDYSKITEKLNQIRGGSIGKHACEVFQEIDAGRLYQYYNS